MIRQRSPLGSRLRLLYAVAGILLVGVNPSAEGSPCPGKSCFELQADGNKTKSGSWRNQSAGDIRTYYKNLKHPEYYLLVNSQKVQLEGYEFEQPVWTLLAFPAMNLFDEGSNSIAIHFVGENLIGLLLTLKYWNAQGGSPLPICSARLNHDTVNTVNCQVTISLKQLDPSIAARIEDLKREIAEYKVQANDRSNPEEQAAHALEKEFEQECAEIQLKLDLLNQELQKINFDDFDSMTSEQMANLFAADQNLAELYQQLNHAVVQTRERLQSAVQSNQQEVTQRGDEIKASFGNLEIPASSFTFAGEVEPLFTAGDPGNVTNASDGLSAASAATTTLDYFDNETEHTVQRLDAALKEGERGRFLTIFSHWKLLQDLTLQNLEKSRVSGASLARIKKAQKRVIEHVDSLVDTYGFFRAVKMGEQTKRIAGQKLKSWNERLSRELLEELNGWQDQLSPAQEKIVQAIDSLGPLLSKMQEPNFLSPEEGKTLPQQAAKELSQDILKHGVESLIQAAHEATEPAAPQTPAEPPVDAEIANNSTDTAEASTQSSDYTSPFGELLAQVQSAVHTAQVLADLALGILPFTAGAKDLYQAYTGVNPITGEALSFNERLFSTVTGILPLEAGGLAKILCKGPLKILEKFGKADKQASAVGQSYRTEEIVQGVEKFADSAVGAAKNQAAFARYVRDLREAMQRPHVQDPHLADMMRQQYRPGAVIGSCSTAAAIRYERKTGELLGGRSHIQKGENDAVFLRHWIQQKPTATPGDRAAAENVLKDLQDALQGPA